MVQFRQRPSEGPNDTVSLIVGHKFPWLTFPAAERCEYNFRSNFHHLFIVFESPSVTEVAAVNQLPAEFALVEQGPILLFLFRFAGGINWSECPYTIHVVPEEDRTLPPVDLGEDDRALLHLYLVDARSGILKAMRAMTFSPEFTRVLHEAIHRQYNTPWIGAEAYDRTLNELRLSYPRVEDLLPLAVARCRGGE